MKLTCLALASALLLAGCGSQKDTAKADIAAVAKARVAVQAAFNARDGQAACKLMTPKLQRQVAAHPARSPVDLGDGLRHAC